MPPPLVGGDVLSLDSLRLIRIESMVAHLHDHAHKRHRDAGPSFGGILLATIGVVIVIQMARAALADFSP